MLRLAFEAAAPGGRLDLAVAREVLSAGSTWNAAWNSIDAALCSSLLSLVFGAAFALLVGATDARGQTPLLFCFLLPHIRTSDIHIVRKRKAALPVPMCGADRAWIDTVGTYRISSRSKSRW